MICHSALAQEITPTTVIYLLDVSGSMKKGGLFENIKGRLKELAGERKIGDMVVLGTFSEDVFWPLKVEIHSLEDISDIKRVIDNLKAEGPWTWMSKAFKETKEKAQDIRAKSPERRLMVYMLTDCINDPPPEVKKIEPPWKFIEVLLNYFEGFKAKDTYIYLLSYRTLEPEEKTKIEKNTPIVVKEPGAADRPIPLIKLSFSGFNFGKIDPSKGGITRTGEVSVDDLQDVEPGENVQLISPAGFEVEPETVACEKKGQKERVSITIPSDLQPGEHAEIIKLRCEEAPVEPPELKFSFFIHRGTKPGKGINGIGKLLKMILPLLILVLLFILYDAFIREKAIWVEKAGEGRTEEVELKGWEKVYLGEKLADKYITFGLPKHYLQRAKLKTHAFLIEEGGEKKRMIFGEDMPPCKDPDEGEVSLRFYEKEPIEEGLTEKKEETKGSSPWDRIEGKGE